MRYPSQKIAYHFLLVSLFFFFVQIIQYMLFGTHATYSQQLDRIIVCLQIAINGAAYYIIPEEAKRDISSTTLAYLHLVLLVAINIFITLPFNPNNIPTYLVPFTFLLLLGNLGSTLWKSHTYTATSIVLLLGFLLAGLAYISELFNIRHPHHVSYWQQWVTDLWVEGIWELIMGSLLGFVLIKITNSREIIEFWLYVMVCFCFIIGLLGSPSSVLDTGASWFSFGIKYSKEILHMFASLALLGMVISSLLATKRQPKNLS